MESIETSNEKVSNQYLNLICNKLNINDKTFPMPLASNNYKGVEL